MKYNIDDFKNMKLWWKSHYDKETGEYICGVICEGYLRTPDAVSATFPYVDEKGLTKEHWKAKKLGLIVEYLEILVSCFEHVDEIHTRPDDYYAIDPDDLPYKYQ